MADHWIFGFDEDLTARDSAIALRNVTADGADTATTSDSTAVVVTYIKSAAESVGPSDVPVAVATYVRTCAESKTVVDGGAKILNHRWLSDSASANDALLVEVSEIHWTLWHVEVVNAADALTLSWNQVENFSSNASAVTSANRVVDYVRSHDSSAGANDAASFIYYRNVTNADSTGTSDSANRVVTFVRSEVDACFAADAVVYVENKFYLSHLTATVADTVTVVATYIRTHAESSLSVSDSSAYVAAYTRTQAEIPSASDTKALVNTVVRSAHEDVVASRSYTWQTEATYVRTHALTATATDAKTVLRNLFVVASSTASASDNPSKTASYVKNKAETVQTLISLVHDYGTFVRSAAETIFVGLFRPTIAVTYVRSKALTATAVDATALPYHGNQVKTSAENLTASDNASRTLTNSRSEALTATATDATVKLHSCVRSQALTATVADAKTVNRGWIRSQADQAESRTGYPLFCKRYVTFVRTQALTATATDLAARASSQIPTTQALTATAIDSAAGVVTYVRTHTESISVADSTSTAVTFVRSVAETNTAVDRTWKQNLVLASSTASASDSSAYVVTYVRASAENLSASDTTVRTFTVVRSLAESVRATDLLNEPYAIGRPGLASTATASDNTVVRLVIYPSVSAWSENARIIALIGVPATGGVYRELPTGTQLTVTLADQSGRNLGTTNLVNAMARSDHSWRLSYRIRRVGEFFVTATFSGQLYNGTTTVSVFNVAQSAPVPMATNL